MFRVPLIKLAAVLKLVEGLLNSTYDPEKIFSYVKLGTTYKCLPLKITNIYITTIEP
jgi:hypothetical protein